MSEGAEVRRTAARRRSCFGGAQSRHQSQPRPQGLLALQHWKARRPWGWSWSCAKEKSSGVRNWEHGGWFRKLSTEEIGDFISWQWQRYWKIPTSWLISQHYRGTGKCFNEIIRRGKNGYYTSLKIFLKYFELVIKHEKLWWSQTVLVTEVDNALHDLHNFSHAIQVLNVAL